ncbi:MAG: NADP-dependent oxidoreductase [Acidimicrobiales bacterium]
MPTPPSNRRIVLARRPHGLVTEEDFRHEVAELPEPAPGEAMVRNLYLSLDPAMRGWMDEGDTYVPAIGIGEVVRCGGVGEVVVSNTEDLASGDLVSGVLGWQDYALVTARGPRGVSKLAPGTDPTMAMSVLGITGLTAWFGLFEVGRPEPGETVVVSGAAGATGSVAAQLAKAHGARVVGIAGGPEKCDWLRSLGLDEAIDYRHDLRAQLKSACPDGIDVFFDNVGGEILETVLHRIRDRARIVMCGAISGYNDTTAAPGPRNLSQLIIHRGRMEGFIVFDYARRFPEAQADLARRVTSGELQWKVDIVDGLEKAPMAMNRLFNGGNTGKLLVKLADPS